jgi:hypothetical protein
MYSDISRNYASVKFGDQLLLCTVFHQQRLHCFKYVRCNLRASRPYHFDNIYVTKNISFIVRRCGYNFHARGNLSNHALLVVKGKSDMDIV